MTALSIAILFIDLSRQTKISNFNPQISVHPEGMHDYGAHYSYGVCVCVSKFCECVCDLATNMQFLAARSLCTSLFSAKYSIPLATSQHILASKSWFSPCRDRDIECRWKVIILVL